jgi:hypothetical protein
MTYIQTLGLGRPEIDRIEATERDIAQTEAIQHHRAELQVSLESDQREYGQLIDTRARIFSDPLFAVSFSEGEIRELEKRRDELVAIIRQTGEAIRLLEVDHGTPETIANRLEQLRALLKDELAAARRRKFVDNLRRQLHHGAALAELTRECDFILLDDRREKGGLTAAGFRHDLFWHRDGWQSTTAWGEARISAGLVDSSLLSDDPAMLEHVEQLRREWGMGQQH